MVELDKHFIWYEDKQFSRNEISTIQRARVDRYMIGYNLKGKKLAKWDLNKIWDEELFFLLLETIGKTA
ncbi:MAG: hypothetical protein LBP53_05660 [Candidatus Peribacteria bacterium]|nr:hypothetical protein [Candidatus Peribacteria bacterium]